MTAQRIGSALIVGGSVAFLLAAAIGVPRVFTQRDPQARLRLLRDAQTRWQVAQPGYALGPLLSAAGVGALALGTTGRGARTAIALAALALLTGAVPWAWLTLRRGRRIAEFAAGTQPAWPFTTYILLTIGGLAALAIGLWTAGFPPWIGWLTAGADALILVAFLRFGDLPPFVFYLLLPVVGIAVR